MGATLTANAGEADGDGGGFAVPPDFRSQIMSAAMGETVIAGRCDQLPVGGNTLTVPTDMTTPWGSAGIQAYWESEASAVTQSKPALQQVTSRLKKLAALVPVTEELFEDSPAMGAFVSRIAARQIAWALDHAVAWGTGAGQPLGFMNSSALTTITAESSQVAATINATNIAKMSAALPVQSRSNAVWLIHPDAEPQLPLMTIANQPIWLPPRGLADGSFGSLFGKPVIPHQLCQTVGTLGDVILADMSQYMLAVKSGGIKSQTSIHLWFDQDITAFKFTLRAAGQPWWSSTTANLNGSGTQSPFVALATRA